MAKFNAILGDLRGKLGGAVFSRNRFGAFARSKVSPVNPRSYRQAQIRSAFGNASNAWLNSLSSAQRDAWRNYAANTPVTDIFGNTIYLTGHQMFVRCNALINYVAGTPIVAGPTTPGVPAAPAAIDLVEALEVLTNGNGSLELTSINAFPSDSINGWYLFMTAYTVVNESTEFNTGVGFEFLSAFSDTINPPDNPTWQYSPNPTAGQIAWISASIMDPQGRLSASTAVNVPVTAP